ncbi:Anillin [Araneus ventricosus]|uniref:Anillin n=1 Tax=Araneus ventricosus TaxID=182803 RepID=A0A4Y2HZR1_ARAVE|nr:Anillin [Araneus ventricosus]
MDLDDSFTAKLLKRTKARKDYLKGKMMDSPARKKRTALVAEQQIPNEDNKEHKESPKRLCVEQVASECEVKENVSVKQKEMEGNNCIKEDEPMEEEAPLRARGLAALRKKHSVQDDPNKRKVSQDSQKVDKPLTYVFSTNSRELCSTRNRLARLAADINGWEDNRTRSALPATSSTNEIAAKEVEETLNRSFEPSNLPMSARKALFEQAALENKVQSEKQAFKPKISVARRAAMFETAPNNKLRFRTAHQKPSNTSPVKPSMKVGSPMKPAAALGPAKPSAVLRGNPARPSAALTWSTAKPSIASTGSPAKSSAFIRDSPAKLGANGESTTTPTKSFIPKTPAEPPMSPNQQQWAKTAVIEKKRPLSSLVKHWEKLSALSSCTNNQPEEEVPSHAFAAQEEESYSLEEEQDDQVESEWEEGQTESEQEEEQVQSKCEEQATSDCEESKSDSTPDEEESGDDDDPFTDSSSFSSKKFAAAAGIETENEDRNSWSDRYSVSDEDSCYPSQSFSSSSCGTTDREDRSGHQPLLHTVSVYRKLIKESRTPPVRHEQVPSLTEKEQGRITDIRETIKHLQEEVVRQQNRIGQSSKLINWLVSTKPEFHGSTEEVEAEKVLLTANDVHYFLCLVRHGAEVIETQMVSTNDKIADGFLHFTNLIKLKNLPPDFSVVFEVFTLDHSKIKLTPKQKKGDGKLPEISSPGGPLAVRSPSFRAVGYTCLTIQNCTEECFTLYKIPFTSPLEGVLKVKLQLHAEHNVTEKGFLTVFEDVSGFGAWCRRWCSLENHLLSYWKYPDDEENKDAIGSIDLRQCITKEVHAVSRDICARSYTFQLVEERPKKKDDQDTLVSRCHGTVTITKRLLSADTKEEQERWCQRLNDALRYIRLWDPKALVPSQ